MRTETSIKGPATLDLRIFDFGEENARLRAAFGSQVALVTLPEDVLSMSAVVAAAKDALSKAGEDAHIPALTKLWEIERQRLEARWEEIAANGFCLSELKLAASGTDALPAIVYQTTKMGECLPRRRGEKADQFWGVALRSDRTTSSIYDTSWRIKSYSDEALALLNDTSLTDSSSPFPSSTHAVLADLLTAVEEIRMRKDLCSLRPLDLDGVIAWDTDVYYPNGWSGLCAFRYYDNGRSSFFVRLEGKTSGLWLDASRSENLRYSRNVGGDDRFKSAEDFHGWLRPLIEMVLAYDLDVKGIIAGHTPPKWLKGSFDPDHPLLIGLNVPPLQRPLMGAMLGKPYQQALRSISSK
ncbi:MAG: hypothetical protein WBG48_01605, partial [Pricia sp.]